jgi:hypothetical protein
MGISLDASRNQNYVEEKTRQEMASRGEVPSEFLKVKKRTIENEYIPPEELAKMRETYSQVVVQDFEDDYHMSREEREAQRKRYSKFFHLRRNYTKKIRRLDKYIEACRLVVEIVMDTAEKNGVMDPDEFILKVLQGKLKIAGLTIPKYQGKGKKTLNWDYIIEYILNPNRDIDELLKSQSTSKCREEEVKEEKEVDIDEVKQYMGEATYNEFAKRIMSYKAPTKASYTSGDGGFVLPETKRQRKALVKHFPGYEKMIREMDHDSKREKTYLWQIQEDDLKWIREFQDERDRKLGDVRPEFNGSLMDEEAVSRYMFEMEQWEKQHNLVKYGENTITEAQKEELEYKKMLEENGYNLRNLYGNKERQKKLEKTRAAQKKQIKSLKKMLSDLKTKQNSANLEGINGSIQAYNSETEQKINKKMKKQKKKKVSKEAKKKASSFDSLLLDMVGSDEATMKDYEKKMKNMMWKGSGK